MPQRYPKIPCLGIMKKTKYSRIEVEAMLIKKVSEVFPSPFIIAPKEVLVYKKGHIKLKDIIKVPASEL